MNRFLRIYPALYVLIIATTLAAIFTKDLGIRDVFSIEQAKWVLSWITVDQQFAPTHLKDFGIGTPNGSLWTIPIELTFYALIHFVFSIKRKSLLLIAVTFLSLFSIISNYLFFDFDYFFNGDRLHRMYSMSLIPHLFWFLFGAIMYVNWNLIKKFIEGRFLYYFIPYLCLLLFNDSFPKVGIHPEMHIRSVYWLLHEYYVVGNDNFSSLFIQERFQDIERT